MANHFYDVLAKIISHLIWSILLGIVLLPTSGLRAQHDLTGYWNANDRGHYYIRQVGDQVYWLGEHPDGHWANVFKGRLNNNTREAIRSGQTVTLEGDFIDIPKGKAQGEGRLELEIQSGARIRKISGSFGGSQWKKKPLPNRLPGTQYEGFSQNGLTGLWSANDGGRYYIRQTGSTVVWLGEKILPNGKVGFANVAFGKRRGHQIILDWVDVPKNSFRGRGELTLRIEGGTIIKESGHGFGGSRWEKGNSESDCDRISSESTIIKPILLAELNKKLAGKKYSVGKLKDLTIKEVKDVTFIGCKATFKVGVKLSREVRRNAHGNLYIDTKVTDYKAGRICLGDATVNRAKVSNTTRLGEKFYSWVGTLMFDGDQECYSIQ